VTRLYMGNSSALLASQAAVLLRGQYRELRLTEKIHYAVSTPSIGIIESKCISCTSRTKTRVVLWSSNETRFSPLTWIPYSRTHCRLATPSNTSLYISSTTVRQIFLLVFVWGSIPFVLWSLYLISMIICCLGPHHVAVSCPPYNLPLQPSNRY
jgi:hypothetical protein